MANRTLSSPVVGWRLWLVVVTGLSSLVIRTGLPAWLPFAIVVIGCYLPATDTALFLLAGFGGLLAALGLGLEGLAFIAEAALLFLLRPIRRP